MAKAQSFEHRVFMGLGDAVLRLIHVEIAASNGTYPVGIAKKERDLIVQALNQQYQLDLGMDCDRDGVPDSIQAFTESAQTSCCRIQSSDEGGKVEPFPEPKVKTQAKKAPSKKAKPAKKKPAPKKKPVKSTSRTRVSSSRKKPAPKKKEAKQDSGGILSNLFGSSKDKK